jgi:predicted RNA-binding Zn-ribbon protein involved in translation (DUF1610 family)
MKKKEKPLFFCDHCGSEVSQEATECSQCGRSFASVRCPICGFIGEGKIFNQGCPNCGYSEPSGTSEPKEREPLGSFYHQKQKSASQHISSLELLPIWVYILTGIIFFGVLAVLYLSIK